jgi:hypothetical protein
MERRRRAETQWTRLREEVSVHEKAAASVRPAPKTPRRWRAFVRSIFTFLMGAGVMIGWNWWTHQTPLDVRLAAERLRELQPAAERFARDGRRANQLGDWDEVVRSFGYALALEPERAEWWAELGHGHALQFQFRAAVSAYDRALAADPSFVVARDALAVCERLHRVKEASPSPSTLYALHRLMMKHGRISEASRLASMIPADRDLQQRTWQERLRHLGLSGTVEVDERRGLIVRLSGQIQEHVELIASIPVAALSLVDTDLVDLKAFTGKSIEDLDVSGTMVKDLSPLKGMPLRRLIVGRTQVEDILPLRSSKIERLDLSGTGVQSLTALRELPLKWLDISNTGISDLRPLAGVPMAELHAASTPVSDLSPLTHLPLHTLALDDTRVCDLRPLAKSELTALTLQRTLVVDLSPLAGTPIAVLNLAGCPELRDLSPLTTLPRLQRLVVPSAVNVDEVRLLLKNVPVIE